AVTTEPAAIAAVLAPFGKSLRRVGHETGALAPWLHVGLQAAGLPVVCLEARQTHVALSGLRNKTDRADARGIAHVVRTGWFRAVHIKSGDHYRLRFLLA